MSVTTNDEKREKVLEQIREMMIEGTNDSKFDKTQMKHNFDNTSAITRWINKKIKFNDIHRVMEFKRKQKFVELYKFYKLESPLKINTNTELSMFIESDEEYVSLLHLCQTIKEAIDYCTSIIENLKGKAWEVNRYIEYQKFIHGK